MYTLQPEKKTRGYTKILAIVCGIALVISVVAIYVFPLVMFASRPIAPTTRDVSYKIRLTEGNPQSADGCAEFSITYTMPGGTQHKEVTVCKGSTLIRKFIGGVGDSLSMTVQNRGNAVRYNCIIDVDGNRIANVASVASASETNCSGSIP